MFRAEIASMVLGIVVTVVCLSRQRWAEAFWVGIQVLAFSCSYWFLSVNRAVLLWFPLFILIGEALSGGWNVAPGRRRLRVLLTIAASSARGSCSASGLGCSSPDAGRPSNPNHHPVVI